MLRSITSDASASVDLGTVSARDAVMLVYGWSLAKAKGPVDLNLVYPVEPTWAFSCRFLGQQGAMDELPMDILMESVRRATGLDLKIEGRQLLVGGLTSANVAELDELLHIHVNRKAVDGLRALVGFGAVVNVGTSVPLIGWLLDLELVELLGIESLIGPCSWAWGLTLPMLIIQLALFAGRVKSETS